MLIYKRGSFAIMLEAIVLGEIPGTSITLSFAAVMIFSTVLLLLVLASSLVRRRSSTYWRTYAEIMLLGVEDQLYPSATTLGVGYENPFVRAKLHMYTHDSTRVLAGYFHRTTAVLRAKSASRA